MDHDGASFRPHIHYTFLCIVCLHKSRVLESGIARPTVEMIHPNASLPYHLADGSSFVCDAFVGVLELVGLDRFPAVVLVLGDECSIGRGITDQLRVILDHGQLVIAER